MSLLQRTTLLSALLAGLFITVPATAADEAESDEKTATDGDVDMGDDDDDAIAPPSDTPADAEAPKEDAAWGVGGEEPEGRYRPSGKTGKLKDLCLRGGDPAGRGTLTSKVL